MNMILCAIVFEESLLAKCMGASLPAVRWRRLSVKENGDLGSPLPVCGHLSHQLFVSLQHLKVLGQFPMALSAIPVRNGCQTPFITDSVLFFLFWKLERFRKKSKFPMKFSGERGGKKVAFCLFCAAFL